ncbi:MAG TPA: GNAT family acetyltransferase [Pseudolysinimonas sp.]|jgi:ribosomal protein S18 acetylase RimI-like enzyme
MTFASSSSARMQVRAFEEGDTDEVVALWRLCGLTRPWNDPRRDIARKLDVQRELFLVGIDEGDGAVIGSIMAGYEGHRGWVNYLAVHPDARGAGHGRALMRVIESLLLARGCPKVNLQVRGDNAEALAFYAAIGYGIDDAVSLGKRLIAD